MYLMNAEILNYTEVILFIFKNMQGHVNITYIISNIMLHAIFKHFIYDLSLDLKQKNTRIIARITLHTRIPSTGFTNPLTFLFIFKLVGLTRCRNESLYISIKYNILTTHSRRQAYSGYGWFRT